MKKDYVIERVGKGFTNAVFLVLGAGNPYWTAKLNGVTYFETESAAYQAALKANLECGWKITCFFSDWSVS
jgi:hypothetical protein